MAANIANTGQSDGNRRGVVAFRVSSDTKAEAERVASERGVRLSDLLRDLLSSELERAA